MTPGIAVVGMACEYPDARTPEQLWENILAQRQSFRPFPPERLRLDDYRSDEPRVTDATYVTRGAFLADYAFDRLQFRATGDAVRAADLSHWLALDVASRALADGGFVGGRGLPADATGVIVGNTLTGEQSRAAALRLRWPYVRRVLEATLGEASRPDGVPLALIERIEQEFKRPFPPLTEETLAGWLSNTIAGRICNHFNFRGGGYTVDGACASSLLAVITACRALAAGDLDAAVVGGVDLSLDPFELVGFARVGALARERMRVYDARSQGFLPGEGCGFVVLLREEDAIATNLPTYAVIRGWGLSSDGHGGLTRPDVSGQMLAMARAYGRAGFDMATTGYQEGHGTGTPVGDAVELEAMSREWSLGRSAGPVAVGSIKANIGHTKAAAGVAGLIKTALALHHRVVPPTTGCDEPHSLLCRAAAPIRVARRPEAWPAGRPVRAGVSAMGFGGINTHVVLEVVEGAAHRGTVWRPVSEWRSAAQNAELILLTAPDEQALLNHMDELEAAAAWMSIAELTDLGVALQARAVSGSRVRAALVARDPEELAGHLRALRQRVSGSSATLDASDAFHRTGPPINPRVGFLFPGHAAPAHPSGGAWRSRFAFLDDLYDGLPEVPDLRDPAVLQPAIVANAIAGLRVLARCGVAADAALGHSLGELVALHWAGAIDETALRELVLARGEATAAHAVPGGAMAAVALDAEVTARTLDGTAVTIAAINSSSQTVVSGPRHAVEALVHRLTSEGVGATLLPVSTAFHSPLMAPVVAPFRGRLRAATFSPLRRPIVSTITGGVLAPDADLGDLLARQLVEPVRFAEAIHALAGRVDVLVEAGPGDVVCRLAAGVCPVPVFALDAGGPSLRGWLRLLGALFVLGAPVRLDLLAGRFARPFDPGRRPRFITSLCEASASDEPVRPATAAETLDADRSHRGVGDDDDALAVVRRLVARRAELPESVVNHECRLLSDLHLNSIAVGQIASEAARALGLSPLPSPTRFADATVRELAEALAETSTRSHGHDLVAAPPGVDAWALPFATVWREAPLPAAPEPAAGRWLMRGTAHRLRARVETALAGVRGGGLAVVFPVATADPFEVVEAARSAAASLEAGRTFLLVQGGPFVDSLARSVFAEAPHLNVCVVEVPPDHPSAGAWIAREVATAKGFVEARYDETGCRTVPALQPIWLPRGDGHAAFGPDDVVVVTGGGHGISAECALSVLGEAGARVAILGRSLPSAEPVARNLTRFRAAGISVRYLTADLADADSTAIALASLEEQWGRVTAVLHGAGTNDLVPLAELDRAALDRVFGPKVHGLTHVLGAIDPDRLRLLVTFGSVTARTGVKADAHYALANQTLTRLTTEFAARHPSCRCLAIEWTVWAGTGMGDRLGALAALERAGIRALTIDEGTDMFRRLLAAKTSGTVVVAGRLGSAATLRVDGDALPPRRFLERPRVHCPGVELVADADLSDTVDRYLEDHELEGQRLFPAVMALEAIAQAATSLYPGTPGEAIEMRDVQFARPITVQPGGRRIRIAALARSPREIDVVIRSDETDFQVEHVRARCRPASRGDLGPGIATSGRARDVCARQLYGPLLFQRGRFARVQAYEWLHATECRARVEVRSDDWFGPYVPSALLLGDPGARDACIHAVQACVPEAVILPRGVDRLVIAPVTDGESGPLVAHAVEREHRDREFVYDIEVRDARGGLRERWEGLRLWNVGVRPVAEARPAAVLPAAVERWFEGSARDLRVGVATAEEDDPSGRAVERALGRRLPVWRRADGRPELDGDARGVSVSHAAGLTMAVVGDRVACDLEPVLSGPDWPALLGREGLALAATIARETSETSDLAATRVWTVQECVTKHGLPLESPVMFERREGDLVWLRAGRARVASGVFRVSGREDAVAVSVLAGPMPPTVPPRPVAPGRLRQAAEEPAGVARAGGAT